MFVQKPVLLVDINTKQKDPDVMLMHFNKAKDLSFTHMQELHDAHQATLMLPRLIS